MFFSIFIDRKQMNICSTKSKGKPMAVHVTHLGCNKIFKAKWKLIQTVTMHLCSLLLQTNL